MTGPLAVVILISWLIRYDAWCTPVIYVPGELPRPAPLYSSLEVCPGPRPYSEFLQFEEERSNQ